MTDALKWKDQYCIGVEDVDLQHEFFLALINRVAEELHKMDSGQSVKSLFQEVVLYAQFHFFSEENLMNRFDYPLLEEHRGLHGDLIDDLTNLKISFEGDHIDGHQVSSFLQDWFLEHTLKEDKKFGDFMRFKD